MGRPTSYTPALAEAICAKLEAGEPLAAICRPDDMPGVRTVLMWAEKHEDFADQYRIAREAYAEWLDAELQRIGETAKDKDTAAAARAQATILMWRASKQAPKKYGDRVDVEVGVKVDLTSLLEARRQRVIEANAQFGLAGPEGEEQ